MKQDPSRGGGSTLSPAYSAALEALAQRRSDEQQRRRSQALRTGFAPAPAEEPKKENPWLSALKNVGGAVISIPATGADIVAKPFELIPGVPDVNPESVGSFNFFVQGGKSLQHAYGDAKELARSIVTGKDTLSQSPSARAYQAAGGGLTGTLAAAGPYLDLGSVVAPMAMGAARGAGLVAPKPVPYKPLTVGQVDATRPMTPYRTTRNALAEDMAQTIPEVTAPQAGRTMNPVEELAAAKTRAETAPVVRDTAAEGTEVNDPYVFNVGGERIVFGPPELDISSVKAGPNGVRVVPIDPYELSNLKMGTEAGDKIADDFTIAMGVDGEMAPALLYAGSRGNKSAMAQFEQLVETGRAKMKQRRAMVNSQPEIPDEVWASTTPEVMVNTGRTVRPANIDDLFLVHETAYAPPTNQAGDVVLSPASEFGPYGRDTVHFALNHVVTQNEGRIFSGDNRYIVIVPLRDALDANPGSLDNLLWGDTFLTPKPGRGLTLPGRSVKVLTNPDGDQIWETLSQVAAAHNKSSGYKVLTAEEVGGHTSRGLSKRIQYLADRVIPSEYDEYVSAIGSDRHGAHQMWNKQASFDSVSTLPPTLHELLSPNSRMQYFRGRRRFLGRDVSEMEEWS